MPTQTQPPDLLGSSPDSSFDFGEFESAQPASSSFSSRPQANGHYRRQSHNLIDLMSDDHLPSPPQHLSWPPNAEAGPSSAPLHIRLPPRPDEITPDYVPPPPLRSPRRLSQLSFSGPNSPPQLSDIVFHPASETRPGPSRANTGSNAQAKLFNTLATTTKIASKWRTSIDPNLFHPPSPSNALPQQQPNSPTPTALPIEVTHTSPFASADRHSASYVAPSGAPAFRPEAVASKPQQPALHEWTGTILNGRRDSTSPVLQPIVADQVRISQRGRQKRLRFSYAAYFLPDSASPHAGTSYHGASLATLYRQAERSNDGRQQNAGNLVIALDGSGNAFGTYINEPISKREGAYYGGGDSFLYKVDDHSHVRPFRWTGKNQYFALCEQGLLSFGGGSGTYGLVFDATFTRNSSATCPTFDNEVLSTTLAVRDGNATPFECVGLEVWTIT